MAQIIEQAAGHAPACQVHAGVSYAFQQLCDYKPMDDMHDSATALLIERLKVLEYSIRSSITVREDQEDDAEPLHRTEAMRYGIRSDALSTKGDLLNAVQTALRAAQTAAGKK